MTAAKPEKRPRLKTFVQVRPPGYEKLAWWPKQNDGWVTLAHPRALGGWSVNLADGDKVPVETANQMVEAWVDDHKDKPHEYRVLHVEDLGVIPKPRAKKKATTKAKKK